MSRLRTKHRPRPRLGLIERWTLQRAGVTGAAAALATLLIGTFAPFDRALVPQIYAALAALTAFCGASILFITLSDMRRRRQSSGPRRAIRGFDGALGILLLAPSLYALSRVWSEAGLPIL